MTRLSFSSYGIWHRGADVASLRHSDVDSQKGRSHLPDKFKPGPQSRPVLATVKWKDFFEDPNLLKLIDTAVANNKEVNIMMQRISVAQNEIQARKGAYLPFVNIGAEAGGEKSGKYTPKGAVENNVQYWPMASHSLPFVGDYQFGLFSTWEIDVWKKLRNADPGGRTGVHGFNRR